MAVLAIAGAGALGSTALGIGWQAGWLIGSTVGSLLFGPDQPDIEGPRLRDLSVTSSAYGAPIPLIYGTMRVSGNVIWAPGIREERQTRKVGGKGGGGQRQTTYGYYASFALGLAEGPAGDLIRIWADGKLIHDARGTNPDVSIPGLEFRFHTGGEDQLPDPLIEATEGHGRTPAFRGLAYLVFEDLPLENFGNRIPNITAEVTFNAQAAFPALKSTNLPGGPLDSVLTSYGATDWQRQHQLMLSPDGLRLFDLRTLDELAQARPEDLISDALAEALNLYRDNFGFDHCFIGGDGYAYTQLGISNTKPVVKIDLDAMAVVDSFGRRSNSLSNNAGGFASLTTLGWMRALSLTGPVDVLIASGRFGSGHGCILADTMEFLANLPRMGPGPTNVENVVQGLVGEGLGEAWILRTSNTGTASTIPIERLRVRPGAPGPVVENAGHWQLSPADIHPEATGFTYEPAGAVYDPVDDALVWISALAFPDALADLTGRYAVKWRPDDGVIWATRLSLFAFSTTRKENMAIAKSRTEGRRMAWHREPQVSQVDLRTGAEILFTDGFATGDIFGGGEAAGYDARSDTLTGYVQTGSAATRLFLNRTAGEGVTPGAIVADICARVGLGPADIDVSQIGAPQLQGYAIGRQGSARAAIEPVAQAFAFDAVETDDRIRFVPRARDAAEAPSLTPDDLVPARETGRVVQLQRVQETDLPERITVTYQDTSGDYNQGAQSATRVSQPVATMGSRDKRDIELPMALEATEAKRIAERLMASAWIERDGVEFALRPGFLRLDPTDLLRVAAPGGTAIAVRLTQVEIGADWELRAKGVRHIGSAYLSEAIGATGTGIRPSGVLGDVPSRWVVPQVPLLRDRHDTGGVASRQYLFAAPRVAGPWTGLSLFRSRDGADWDIPARISDPALIGTLRAALAPPRSVWTWDAVNALDVRLRDPEGRLESVSDLQLLNGRNAALVVDADGGAELIQFRDVTPLGNDIYRLSTLLRGRRGTDGRLAHAAGAVIVVLDDEGALFTEPLGLVGQQLRYRGVGRGEAFDEADTVTQVVGGTDLKPYTPAHVAGVWTAAGITLSWRRRTRIGGDWRDGTGTVPLAEAAEAYEVDILDGAGDVIRVLETATPQVLYAAAQAQADFGTVPDTLTLCVHQTSAAVGRGFPATATVRET
ncbi:phage tail protein [Roseovarius sp. D22-M7]|uniref:phage tail protein n=1 Tax=Roseovarius sp. D22-M7 TaxID=3127116 RepID=UPI0030104E65